MSLDQGKMMIAYDRKRTSTLTLDEQPGAHTGATRQYIPGYSDSNIVYLDTAAGNDSNDGSTELLAKLTYASAATAAGSTKKIRVVNDGAALSTNITKPTEMKRGLSGTISPTINTNFNTWSTGTATGAKTVAKVMWSHIATKFIMLTNNVSGGDIQTSADGITFAVAVSGLTGTNNPSGIAEGGGVILIATTQGVFSSTDGITFSTVEPAPMSSYYGTSLKYYAAAKVFVVGAENGTFYTWAPGDSAWAERRVANLSTNLLITALHKKALIFIGNRVDGSTLLIDTFSVDENFSATKNEALDIGTHANGAASDGNKIVLHVNSLSTINARVSYDDGATWIDTGVARYSDPYNELYYVPELSRWFCGSVADYAHISTDGITWAQSAATSSSSRGRFAYSPTLGRLVGPPQSNLLYYCDIATQNVSANIAGFSITAFLPSAALTAYNCTFSPFVSAYAVSTDLCRVGGGTRVTANAQIHRATLFKGDTYFTTTPASQNAFSLNSNTFGGKCYILNSSQTGYEQIRDNLFADGIDATWPVTVSGRDNVQGVSSNALFGFQVTFNDPKFVDETDYALQYQTNGYDRNSLAAGRSNIYYNSAGGRRDIGAWSYIESAVTYYHAKTAYISKPTKISVTYEETVSEQQGDNGPVSVYTKPSRVKEILTLVYDVTEAVDRAIFDYIRTLRDKGVKVQLFPEWGMNGSTVTVNGNQSAGVEFLTIDAAQVFNGLFLTIAGERYYVLRASPNNTAATKLILDRSLGVSVSDNDVITTNYPPGAGEYQFSPPPQLTLEYVDPDTLLTFMRGQTLRFVREWSP